MAQSLPPASALLVVVDEHDGQFLSVHLPVASAAARQSSVSDVRAHASKHEESAHAHCARHDTAASHGPVIDPRPPVGADLGGALRGAVRGRTRVAVGLGGGIILRAEVGDLDSTAVAAAVAARAGSEAHDEPPHQRPRHRLFAHWRMPLLRPGRGIRARLRTRTDRNQPVGGLPVLTANWASKARL
jgi:hypothetical protein